MLLTPNLVNEVFIDRFTDPAVIATELITGPIATFSLEQEIVGGFGVAALAAFNAALSIGPGPPFFIPFLPPHVSADCRDLNRFSYGVVDVDAIAGTATVALKDDTGAPVINQVPPAVPCALTFGP
jgi:hypothetical protein